jgi:tetratricopeptide (TPR) repeat protein
MRRIHREALFAVVVLLSRLTPGAAQSAMGEDDPRLQQLYTQAKAAESSGDLAGAAAKYESMIEIAPRLAVAYNNLGAVYFKEREYRRAAAVLEKGLKINPAMPSSSALLGMSLFEMGEYAKGRPHLETALHANPKDTHIELFLVNDLTRLGDFEGAAAHLTQLSNREPQNQQIWYLLGKVYTQLAQQALAKMNAIDPNSVWTHEISGEIMEGMKNYDGALIEYKKAVEAAPKQPGAHYKLGDLYWSLSEWDEATREFEAELANDPGNCMAQWKLGDILLQQSLRPEEALADIDKSLAMCPNLVEARSDRGRLLVRLHRNEEAIPELQAAIQANAKDPTSHFALAQAYRALGRTQEAQREMQLFSKLDAETRAATAEQAQEAIKNKEKAH